MELLSWGNTGWGDEIFFASLVTIALAICSFAFGTFLGLYIAIGKLTSNKYVAKSLDAYTTIVRGVPELLIVYLLFFGGENAITQVARVFGYNGFINLPPFMIGVLAIGFISAGYSAEVFRGAIQSIKKGQIEAGLSLNLDEKTIFNKIILPQAVRVAIPALGNIWQLTLKDTALISVTGLAEIMRISRIATNSEREPFIFFITAAIIFLILTSVSTNIQKYIETKFNKGVSA
ncbi:MAG: ABC transporter permease [Alphaproteobacteria bacterium]